MIVGSVIAAREAIVSLTVRGLDGRYELRVVVRSGGTVTIRSLNDGESGA